MKRELITYQEPKSLISETFRTLRTNIQFMNTKGKLKSILITSTMPGEGKSWVAANLAVTFAQAEKKVILIDADMRKGRQYSIFDVLPKPGLSNYLSGINENEDEKEIDLADYIQPTDVDNLYLIAAGNIPPNPSELLTMPQMVDLLVRLKELCDIIVIDGTPCQLVSDALILARLVDSTVIVTSEKETKKEDLKKTITNINQVGGKISGVILNKIPVSTKKYEQTYYYGHTNMPKQKSKRNTQGYANRNDIKRQNSEIYNRASNIMAQGSNRDYTKEKNGNSDNGSKNNTNINQNVSDDVLPNSLQNKIKIENNGDVSVEKTAEILEQINKYLDEEKKKLS